MGTSRFLHDLGSFDLYELQCFEKQDFLLLGRLLDTKDDIVLSR